MNIEARPWRPQDLLDDLQQIIDEEPDRYLNSRRTTLCMALDYLKEHFAPLLDNDQETGTGEEDEPQRRRELVFDGTIPVGNWWRTESAIPKAYTPVLCYYPLLRRQGKACIHEGWIDASGEWHSETAPGLPELATHWMPMPAPPNPYKRGGD